MIRFITAVAASVSLLCMPMATQAQTAGELAQREAQARAALAPQFEAGMRLALKQTRDTLPIDGMADDEVAALLNAYDIEVDRAVSIYGERFVTIMARHVPLDQLTAEADTNTPEWRAAMTEVMAMIDRDTRREGMEMAERVIKVACAVRAQPSPPCANFLAQVGADQTGR